MEAYRLKDGQWVEAGLYGGEDQAAIQPFDAVLLDLGSLKSAIYEHHHEKY